MDYNSLLSSILKLLGVISPVILGWYVHVTNRKDKLTATKINELKQDKTASTFNMGLLSNLMKLDLYKQLSSATIRIFKRTRATRVIIFVAINGKLTPRKVYALFGEMSDNTFVNDEFRGIEVDDPYVDMLHSLERNESLSVETMKMKPSLLKNIYLNEGITYSYLKFIKRYHLTEEDDAIVYMSVATDSEKTFHPVERSIIDMRVSSSYKVILDKIVK
jgi:hypothetical protein